MKGTHLTLEDRKAIQHGLEECLSRTHIGKDLGKHPSTISKEIKLHRKFKLASAYNRGHRYFCANSGKFKECYGCNAEILRKEAASAETASVSATSAPITPNAVLISITTMPQKPMKSIFPPSAIHEKA